MSRSEERRALVRQLLQAEEIRSQDELRSRLRDQGHSASQPVLSRDLRLLGVGKEAGVYRIREPERVTPLSALRSLLRSVRPARDFVLVRCESGAASAVARALEAEEIDGLVGTVAGDDTVLVASASRQASQRVSRRIASLTSSV